MNALTLKMNDNYLLFLLLCLAAISIFAYSWVPGGLDKANCRIILKYKDRIIVVNPADTKLIVTLPK